MPRISIIVPVYNVEKYLRKCVDSILAQTFTGFECILIDDSSTDGSPQICDEYAAKDRRIITVHHTANAGLSATRNTGLDRASGEWIGFVDSDDWCDRGMFQFLYDNAIKYDVDISICGYREVEEGTGKIYEPEKSSANKIGKEILYDNRPDDAVAGMFTRAFAWNKLIKAECIRRLQLRFDPAARYIEDMVFMYPLFKSVGRVFYSPESYYNYLIRRDSESHQPVLKRVDCILGAYNHIIADEQNKKLKKKIILYKTDFVSDICYLEAENFRDSRYNIFSRTAKEQLFAIFSLPLPIKARLSRVFCVVSPAAFVFLRRAFRAIKRRPAR